MIDNLQDYLGKAFMKLRPQHFPALLAAILIMMGTAFWGSLRTAYAESASGPTETALPAENGTVYNAIQHFLYHVAARDIYSFYDTIPCTGELKECIGYMLDAYQSQGVDLISRFNLHPASYYPYANVRLFCERMDDELSPGDTVTIPCGNGAITFLYQKYDNADAAFAAGAMDVAGTMALLTKPSETYGHCWISLGKFAPDMSAAAMQAWLESYYQLSEGALGGKIATNDENMVWKAYPNYGIWRVHSTRWSSNVHGGCIIDNDRADETMQDASCYVLIPTSDTEPTVAQGDLKIDLASSLPAVTGGNYNYSLSGVSLGVYTDAACTKALTAAVTDANGSATIHHLAAGTVYVKPKTAAMGYEAAQVKSIEIRADETVTLTIPMTPKTIQVKPTIRPQEGSASLEGAIFSLRFYACTDPSYIADYTLAASWTLTASAEGVSFGTDAAVEKAPEGTDGFFTNASGELIFPLGFLALEQTGAAEGQTLGGSWTVSARTGSGVSAATLSSSQEGSNAPVILFTKAYTTLQCLLSDTVTSYLAVFSPTGDIPESLSTDYTITADKRVTGLRFGTTAAKFIEQLGLSPSMRCTVVNADGTEKAADAEMRTGDSVKILGQNGEVYLDGTVLLYGDVNGDGLLRMSDLIKVRNHVLGTNPLSGIFLEAADCNHDGYIRMSDLIKIRNEVLGTGTIVQTAP